MSDQPAITVRSAATRDGIVFIADGPGGHVSLLARGTELAAARDGLEYFLRTRELVDGEWRLRRLESHVKGERT